MITVIRQSDELRWSPDATLDITVESSATISPHPIEDGASVVDNIQRKQRRITAVCRVSQHPSVAVVPEEDVGLVGGVPWLITSQRYFDRTPEELLTVQTTRHGTFKNCLLVSATPKSGVFDGLEMTLTFVEIEIADAPSTKFVRARETPRPRDFPNADPSIAESVAADKEKGLFPSIDFSVDADTSVARQIVEKVPPYLNE